MTESTGTLGIEVGLPSYILSGSEGRNSINVPEAEVGYVRMWSV